MQSIDEVWSALRDSLRGNSSEAMWSAGLGSLRLVDYQNDELIISAPNQIQLLRVQQRYLPLITEQAQQLLGKSVTVSLTVGDDNVHEPAPDVSLLESEPVAARVMSSDRPLRLDPRMTFDTFVVGNSNQLARSAAFAAAETPGRAYNPLLMYGNSGLGKTHLLHAIGNYVQENYPYRKVLYVSTETF